MTIAKTLNIPTSKHDHVTEYEFHVVDKGLHKEIHIKVWGSDWGAF